MLQNLNATKKGILTAVVMIILSLLFFYTGNRFESSLQYIIYIVFALGIIWTVYDYSKGEDNNHKFGEYFLQGFKCFIVIALLMVLFTILFNKMHPEFKEEMAVSYQAELVKKGNSTPAEITANVEKMKDYYIVMLISGAIFGYLLLGAAISAMSTLVFLKRK